MVICKFIFASSQFLSHPFSPRTADGEEGAGWAPGAGRGQLLPSPLRADHLQREKKGFSSDIYYRENEYTEKL